MGFTNGPIPLKVGRQYAFLFTAGSGAKCIPAVNLNESNTGKFVWGGGFDNARDLVFRLFTSPDFVAPDTDPPDQATLSAPTDGALTTDNTPTFDWSDSADNSPPVTYDLQVDNNADFSSPEISQTAFTTSTFTPGTALADGIYKWRVRATDSKPNVGDYTEPFTFTIDTTLPSVALTSVVAPSRGFQAAATKTSFPATVGTQPVTVSGTVSDNIAVALVKVNGTTATISDNTWSLANVALSVGDNTLNVVATDTSGHTANASATVTYDTDLDDDGIANTVDGDSSVSPAVSQSTTASTRFSDIPLGGATSGRITLLELGISITIVDKTPNPAQGLDVVVSGPAAKQANLRLDVKGSTLKLKPGSYGVTDP